MQPAGIPVPGLFFQAKSLMQGPDRQFHIFFINDDRNLDFRCRDHQDIDTLGEQRAEHLGCDTDMAPHTDADGGNLGNLGITDDV